ncbi:glycine cleavage system protein R [Teredinibacter turnerae]|uniref:Glycine cleavage system transcriptional repressor n=1 Tax=Teredinibacter turnerae (strain ATCC 39867 / T7901) TaxID=377629 RepID=C5BR40_TERTT|nr:ACT domain-containing protein [Teredinibacter turnerae]ACR13869.1 ACT domain protein [Teredinibacter turnerae T7901]
MNTNLILTVISDDKPGVVEALARTIAEHNGNWLESQLAHLAGKFAGVVQVQVASDSESALVTQLEAMSAQNIRIFIDRVENSRSTAGNSEQTLFFHAVGPDRPGIVREVAHTFAHYGINMEKLDTRLSSMPYSGEPLFEAEGTLTLPQGLDRTELEERLDDIANQLAMDISLRNVPSL